MEIKGTNKPPEARKRFYICDRTKCEPCAYDCKFTQDIKHALFPDVDVWVIGSNGTMWQKVR